MHVPSMLLRHDQARRICGASCWVTPWKGGEREREEENVIPMPEITWGVTCERMPSTRAEWQEAAFGWSNQGR